MQNVINAANEYVAANFPKAKTGALPNVRVLVGGGAVQEDAVADLVMKSQIISLLVSVWLSWRFLTSPL